MKKNLLIAACIFLSLASKSLAAETPKPQEMPEIKQKSCQNVFSFINIDLSVMSPRAAASDISVTAPPMPPEVKKGAIVPVSNKPEQKPQLNQPELKAPMANTKNKTSLFRIDLLHIFKIQIL